MYYRAARMAEMIVSGEEFPKGTFHPFDTTVRDVSAALVRMDPTLDRSAAMELVTAARDNKVRVTPTPPKRRARSKGKKVRVAAVVKKPRAPKPTAPPADKPWATAERAPSNPGAAEPLLAYLEAKLLLNPRDATLLAAMQAALLLAAGKG